MRNATHEAASFHPIELALLLQYLALPLQNQ
jgi:hypothetical protein